MHVFKYLEIQAIKEDRRRGVLTDAEYRRSYRKASSNNNSSGANNAPAAAPSSAPQQSSSSSSAHFGFSADARRKRHTADSGYGSEQPLDRRCSQEFSQDVST